MGDGEEQCEMEKEDVKRNNVEERNMELILYGKKKQKHKQLSVS